MADLNRAWDGEAPPTPRSGPEVRSGEVNGKTNIVVLDAMGGTGKTALVNHFVNGLAAQGWRGAEAVYVWSFYSQGTDERRQASADDFFKHALAFFGHTGEAPSNPHDKGVKLAELIAAKRALVILDGLEPLQYGPSRRSGGSGDAGLTGGLRDQGILALVRQVARENAGLLVVTTRLKVPDLKGFAAPAVIAEPLLPIPTPDGVEMIRSAGVKGKHEELAALVKDLRGHAIALVQVATWLVTYRDGDVRCRNEVPSLVDLGGDNERDPFRVMMTYEIQFKRQIAEQVARGQTPADIAAAKQLGLLFLMGLFDRPMERGDREALMRSPAIPGITEALAGLTPGQLEYAVQSLRALGLLLPKDDANPHDLDAHPLVREYFGLRLEKENPDAFQAAHGRLYDEYRYRGLPAEFQEPVAYGVIALAAAFPRAPFKNDILKLADGRLPQEVLATWPPSLGRATPTQLRAAAALIDGPAWKSALAAFLPDTAEAMAPLFTAIAHGCAAGRHDEVWGEVYRPRVARGNENFAVHKLGLYGSDLGAIAQFFTVPFAVPAAGLPPARQALVLNLAGFRLRALGRLAEAVEPMRIGAALQASQKDWTNAASGHSNLAELLQTLGRLRDGPAGGAAGTVEEGAVTTAARSVTYADQSQEAGSAGGATRKQEAAFQAMARRTTRADALLAAGDWAAARARFQEAERRQREMQPALPLLYSLPGFRLCDLTLAHGRAREVTARYDYFLSARQPGDSLLDQALETLVAGRAAHLAALDAAASPTGAKAGRDSDGRPVHGAALDAGVPSPRIYGERAEAGPDAPASAPAEGEGRPHTPTLGADGLDHADAPSPVAAPHPHNPSGPLPVSTGRGGDGRTAGDPNAPQGDGSTAAALAATAARHLDAAVDGLRAAGDAWQLPRGLLARAAFHRDFPAAIVGSGGLATRDLTEAFEIAERGGMRLFLAEAWIESARQRLAKPAPSDDSLARAGAALDKAAALIAETGYQRRAPDLALARAELALATGDTAAAQRHLAALVTAMRTHDLWGFLPEVARLADRHADRINAAAMAPVLADLRTARATFDATADAAFAAARKMPDGLDDDVVDAWLAVPANRAELDRLLVANGYKPSAETPLAEQRNDARQYLKMKREAEAKRGGATATVASSATVRDQPTPSPAPTGILGRLWGAFMGRG